jgi:hypothetical protein
MEVIIANTIPIVSLNIPRSAYEQQAFIVFEIIQFYLFDKNKTFLCAYNLG